MELIDGRSRIWPQTSLSPKPVPSFLYHTESPHFQPLFLLTCLLTSFLVKSWFMPGKQHQDGQDSTLHSQSSEGFLGLGKFIYVPGHIPKFPAKVTHRQSQNQPQIPLLICPVPFGR